MSSRPNGDNYGPAVFFIMLIVGAVSSFLSYFVPAKYQESVAAQALIEQTEAYNTALNELAENAKKLNDRYRELSDDKVTFITFDSAQTWWEVELDEHGHHGVGFCEGIKKADPKYVAFLLAKQRLGSRWNQDSARIDYAEATDFGLDLEIVMRGAPQIEIDEDAEADDDEEAPGKKVAADADEADAAVAFPIDESDDD